MIPSCSFCLLQDLASISSLSQRRFWQVADTCSSSRVLAFRRLSRLWGPQQKQLNQGQGLYPELSRTGNTSLSYQWIHTDSPPSSPDTTLTSTPSPEIQVTQELAPHTGPEESQHTAAALSSNNQSIDRKVCLAPHHSQAGLRMPRSKHSHEWWPHCWIGHCAASPGHLHAPLLRDGAVAALSPSSPGHKTSHLLLARVRGGDRSEWGSRAPQPTTCFVGHLSSPFQRTPLEG